MTAYGIHFPFKDSLEGNFLKLTYTTENEVRSNLIHFILTKKGSRYFLPDFGTRIYEYIFEQNDMVTFNAIEEEIREGIKKYIPNLEITKFEIISAENDEEDNSSIKESEDERLFRISDNSTKPYTAKIKIEYSINNGTFTSSDFIIINI